MRRLLIDVTDTLAREQRTGIQRVVREFARHGPGQAGDLGFETLFVAAIGGRFHAVGDVGRDRLTRPVDTRPVAAPPSGRVTAWILRALQPMPRVLLAVQQWNLNRRYAPGLFPLVEAEPLAVQDGDLVLLLDSYWGGTTAVTAAARAKRRGAQVVPVVYDLIPLTHPEYSTPLMFVAFAQRVRRALTLASGCLTISKTCAEQLRELLGVRAATVPVRYFHLGDDPVQAAAASARPASTRHRFVLVGSIEPHKGHDVALDAFEQLWARGFDLELSMIGRLGNAKPLIARLEGHPELGHRLHLVHDATDAQLGAAIGRADATIMASRAEGFGLPIVESLRLGVPVIASDIPVFREIGGEAVRFFACGDADSLAHAVQMFLPDMAQARAAAGDFDWITWSQSAAQTLVGVAAVT